MPEYRCVVCHEFVYPNDGLFCPYKQHPICFGCCETNIQEEEYPNCATCQYNPEA